MKNLTCIAIVLFLLFINCINSAAEMNVIASWYGGGEPLNEFTANGEIFDSSLLTCASWSYPFGTLLKVTNVESGRYVIVRVNDRGPNKRLGRAIDLTKEAFGKIADIRKGLINVNIEKVLRSA